MRNFSQAIDLSCTYVLDEEMRFTDPAFVRIREALIITMGANPDMMTPSEEAVLADFIGWCYHNRECTLYPEEYNSLGGKVAALERRRRPSGATVVRPIFCYHNLNKGHSVAVIWTDSKRKVSYVQAQ